LFQNSFQKLQRDYVTLKEQKEQNENQMQSEIRFLLQQVIKQKDTAPSKQASKLGKS